jgi:hypothetical protein
MSNPFTKLKISRDREDEEELNAQTQKKETGQELFKVEEQQTKKKKKVRPEEKKKMEEQEQVKDDEEGFSVVQKIKKPTRGNDDYEVVEQKQNTYQKFNNDKHKGGNQPREVRPNQRQFDKHSGTGRGKEVSKGGAGGKYTWGNEEKQAKREVYDYDQGGVDHFFDSALNPKPKREKREYEETRQEEVPVQEVKVEVVVPETIQNTEAVEDNLDKKGRKKKVNPEEEKEEDKLIIPENAISLEEYRKNKPVVVRAVEKTTVRVESNLKEMENKKDNAIESKKKPAKKKKETLEKELNIPLKVEESTNDWKSGYSNQQTNKKGGKKGNDFKFKQDDFPELK